jgi:hypothetical protein
VLEGTRRSFGWAQYDEVLAAEVHNARAAAARLAAALGTAFTGCMLVWTRLLVVLSHMR